MEENVFLHRNRSVSDAPIVALLPVNSLNYETCVTEAVNILILYIAEASFSAMNYQQW